MQPNSAKQSQSAQGNYQPSVPISLYKELASELQSAQNKVTSLQVQNEQLLKQNQTLIREFTKEFEAIANSSQQLLQLLKTLSPEIQAQAQAVMQQEYKEYRQPEIVPPPSELPKITETISSNSKPVNYLQEIAPRVQETKTKPNVKGLEPEQGEPRVRRSPEATAKPKSVNTTSPQLPQRQAAVKSTTPSQSATPSNPPSIQAPTPKVKTHEGEASTLPDLESDVEEAGMNNWWLALTIILIVITSFGAGYFLMRPFINSK